MIFQRTNLIIKFRVKIKKNSFLNLIIIIKFKKSISLRPVRSLNYLSLSFEGFIKKAIPSKYLNSRRIF